MVRQLFVALLTSALLVACQPAAVPVGSISQAPPVVAATATPEVQQPSGSVPLAEAVDSLEPQLFWQNFYSLTQVPRPSHHEEQVSAFLAKFGEDLGLETIVDDVGNVIIRKPATKGMEDRQGVVLQAHMDMVAQKTSDSTHDFLTDPIEAYVEDGWVKAVDTTLGADDGSGVAMIMTLLQEEDIAHGPLEGLFTVNEEDGFTGVNALEPGILQGTILINVDSEESGVFTIGSAGGVYTDITTQYELEEVPADYAGYTVEVSGLQGGHSGMDIAKNRGNANRLLARLLWLAEDQVGLRVASIAGGDVSNAIPRSASAVVMVPEAQAEAFTALVRDLEATLQQEYAATEPALQIQAAEGKLPDQVLPEDGQRALVSALYGSPNGVEKMSDAVPGLVETSTNLGILTLKDGTLTAGHYTRSAVDSERDDLAQMVQSVFELAGTNVGAHGAYSGWPPNPDSPIVKLMQSEYESLFGEEAAIEAIHAGLETSVIGAKYPEMDMISVGPTLQSVHSPDERMEVSTVAPLYQLLVATLADIPAKE
jgi:dipeptidase D